MAAQHKGNGGFQPIVAGYVRRSSRMQQDTYLPASEGIKLDAIIEAGERLPGIAALWKVATPEERRELIALLLEPGGFYYDLELRLIAAIKPRPVFLPLFRLIAGLEENEEASGTLVTSYWRQRNRRDSNPRSPA
jgi:site-specific DNA recombinase